MKKFDEMSDRDQLAFILENDDLREAFDSQIWDDISFWISEKLSVFERGAVDYEWGTCCYCWFKVLDADDFLDGMDEFVHTFALSTRVERMLRQTQKLRYTNLFNYMVEKLADAFWKEEVKDEIEWYEDVSYDIYCKDVDSDKLPDYLDFFIFNHGSEIESMFEDEMWLDEGEDEEETEGGGMLVATGAVL